jgi:hypothetical protein
MIVLDESEGHLTLEVRYIIHVMNTELMVIPGVVSS